MLKPRTAQVLSSIVKQYIETAMPVSSASVLADIGLNVCSATIRNEMVFLEEEGYIVRPHHAAGSIPVDKAYRYYVGTLDRVGLPVVEQLLISHLFHQVEDEIEEWMELTGSLLAKQMRNLALVTRPVAPATRFKHLELISLQPLLALVILVLEGARVKQQLISLESSASQEELSTLADRLSKLLKGKSVRQIKLLGEKLTSEKPVIEAVIHLMEAEARKDEQSSYIDGLPYLLSQPEFASGEKLSSILSLVEQKRLTRIMNTASPTGSSVNVVIGEENQSEEAKDFSLVLSHYGIADEFTGTIGIFGPTRMQYEKAIAMVGYLSLVMSKLVAELYGRRLPPEPSRN